MSRDIENNCF